LLDGRKCVACHHEVYGSEPSTAGATDTQRLALHLDLIAAHQSSVITYDPAIYDHPKSGHLNSPCWGRSVLRFGVQV
jgi:hypothetical protein